MTPTDRVIAIVALMQRGYWSPEKIAQKLQVRAHTIRKDLAAMTAGGVRLQHDGVRQHWTLRRPR
jgi:DeoR/GlpR family transcriptional regulator of sugar metabolism